MFIRFGFLVNVNKQKQRKVDYVCENREVVLRFEGFWTKGAST